MTEADGAENREAMPIGQAVRRSLALLGPEDKRKYRWAVVLQMATAFLDLAGVLLFGMVGVIASSAAQGAAVPATVQTVLSWFGLADASPATSSLVLAGAAAILLTFKSIASLWILRRVANFLSRCSAQVSAQMCADFFALPIVCIQKFRSQWSAFALINGVPAAVTSTLTNAMVIWVEVFLLVVLGAALLLIDPIITLFAIGYFSLAAFLLFLSVKSWAGVSGKVLADTGVNSFSTVYDAISTYREATVANRRDYYVHRFRALRAEGSTAFADQLFIGQIPRYGMEMALVLGAVLFVSALAMSGTVESALGSLALFLTASTRVMPSLLRLNGSRITLHGLVPLSDYAFTMQDHIASCLKAGEGESLKPEQAPSAPPGPEVPDLHGPDLTVVVSGLTVRYPGTNLPALDQVSFILPPGRSLAVVGPSGAGKSTLADAILGVLEPASGSVTIGGMSPSQVVRRYPGLVAYVPQAVALVSGSVRDNVALGVTSDEVDDNQVWAALRRAHLADYLFDAREGLDTPVGEHGVQLSGGQRQRLGIARALYTDPRLLVMDEATSAMDAETEHLITQTIEGLGPDVTIVTIAHRLATIRRSDIVIYLDRGSLVTRGTFEEVRKAIPHFDHQANLLGL